MGAASPASVVSHWYQLIQGLQASPQEFYNSVEAAIQKRQLPNASISRIDYHEGGVMSAKREYLRVRGYEYIFDICGAPFGNGLFVSWWLGELEGCLAFFFYCPILGPFLKYFFGQRTYYQIDTALMFQSAVHSAVLEVVDQLTSAGGIRALSELERKPILREFYRR